MLLLLTGGCAATCVGMRMVNVGKARQAHRNAAEAAAARAADLGMPLSELDFALLADEQHPAGPQRLEQVLDAKVEMRSMAALDTPQPYTGVLRLAVAAAPPADVQVSYRWVVSRDGKPTPHGSDWKVFPPPVLPTWEAREALPIEHALACTDAERAAGRPFDVHIDHELELRICRAGRNAGTILRARFIAPRKVTVVPSFPMDYPRAVTGPLLAMMMEEGLRARGCTLELLPTTTGRKQLRCRLRLSRVGIPRATAGRLLLSRQNGPPSLFATGSFRVDAQPDGIPDSQPMPVIEATLDIVDMSKEDEATLLDALRKTHLQQLRVRLEAEREIALSTTSYDEMWYGVVETNVQYDWRE